jgi:predicted flavoprotein YhiN
MSTIRCDVVVIGAGAAGLMTAITAGQRGRQVQVIDHANKVGKKILMSGGGRCNFTNTGTTPANFLSANPHFCKSALARYTPWHFIELVHKHGIAYHEKELGQLFCDISSKQIVKMLVDECQAAGVQIRTDCSVQRIEHGSDGFRVHTTQGLFHCASLVVATGGLSIPSMGATGFGYEVARQFGHQVLPTRAGLVPLTLSGKHQAAGRPQRRRPADRGALQRQELPELHAADPPRRERPGDPADLLVLAARRCAGAGPAARPGCRRVAAPDEARAPGRRAAHGAGRGTAEAAGAAPVRALAARPPVRQLDEPVLRQAAQLLGAFPLVASGTEGYRTAEVTLGGVDTAEVSSSTMESKRVPGLHFVGEVLDVTGWLGGYNFQWAWASGHAAGGVV